MAKTKRFDKEAEGIRILTGADALVITCKDCGLESPVALGSRAYQESICWACQTFPGCGGDIAAGFFKEGPLRKRLRKLEDSE